MVWRFLFHFSLTSPRTIGPFSNWKSSKWYVSVFILSLIFRLAFIDLFDEEWDIRRKILEEDLSRKLEGNFYWLKLIWRSMLQYKLKCLIIKYKYFVFAPLYSIFLLLYKMHLNCRSSLTKTNKNMAFCKITSIFDKDSFFYYFMSSYSDNWTV